MGRTDAEIARRVGVTRVTVNQWRNHDPDFMSELQARRKQLWDRQRDGLMALCGKAMEILEQSLASADEKTRFWEAFELLRLPALQEHLKPVKEAEDEEKIDMLDVLEQSLGMLEAQGMSVQPKREEGEQRYLTPPN